MIFIALITCAWLWGPIGALLAIPILMTVKVIGDRVPELNPLSELLGLHTVAEAAAAPVAQVPASLAPGPIQEMGSATGSGLVE